MMQEASSFKGFYNLVKVTVFVITISNFNYRRVKSEIKIGNELKGHANSVKIT